MSKLQLYIQDRRGKQLTSFSIGADATTDDLKTLFAKECQSERELEPASSGERREER